MPARVIAGLALVIACAAAVFGVRVLLAEKRATPVDARQTAATAASAAGASRAVTGTSGPVGGFAGPRRGGEPSGLVSARQTGGAASQPGQPATQGVSGVPVASGQPGAAGQQAGQQATGQQATGQQATGQQATGQPGQQITVHVVGQVARAGVIRLAAGARVADAVQAAGGLTTKADAAAVNLARPLVDGEQIRIPRPGEALPSRVGASGQGATGPGAAGAGAAAAAGAGGAAGAGQGGAAGGAAQGASGGGAGGLVNLNTADLAALDTLPGVGPVLAQRILDWRTEHGRFTSVDELGEVSGIGEKLMAQLGPKVTV
ncbi:helix-hairpin-helix domain-containing protein [Actinomycetota bacterium]